MGPSLVVFVLCVSVIFYINREPFRHEISIFVMKHVLIGPIKSYDSSDTILEEANYWKDVPLDKKVALEIDHPGPHYLIASVQFANGTSGIYSGVLDVNAIGIKPSSDDYVQFKLDGGNAALGVVKIEQSDTSTTKSDPVFQQIASKIICSDLSDKVSNTHRGYPYQPTGYFD
jgi:hypothetical protein